MLGGAGLTGLYAPDGDAFLASWDQSNAFTAVRTPSWWWPWMAVPPGRAGGGWDRLPRALQRRSVAASWVYPRYTRLPMGGSHSDHILMTINMHVVGMALVSSYRPKVEWQREGEELAEVDRGREGLEVELE